MTIHQSIAGSGASPVGEPQSPAGSRLIRDRIAAARTNPASKWSLLSHTASSWVHEREQEARESGYRVEYRHERGTLIASFFNGPFHCYDREHVL